MVFLTLLKTFLATYYSNCFQKLSVSKNVNKKNTREDMRTSQKNVIFAKINQTKGKEV